MRHIGLYSTYQQRTLYIGSTTDTIVSDYSIERHYYTNSLGLSLTQRFQRILYSATTSGLCFFFLADPRTRMTGSFFDRQAETRGLYSRPNHLMIES